MKSGKYLFDVHLSTVLFPQISLPIWPKVGRFKVDEAAPGY